MELIYCDDDIIVAVKPSRVLSTDEPGGMPELVRQALGDENADVRTVHRLDRVVSGVANRVEELNGFIQKYSIGWDVARISRLTRCIMQLAIFEIKYVEDVPTGVAISEAVRIAKMYDGDDTGSFVNGILGSFARSGDAEVAQ